MRLLPDECVPRPLKHDLALSKATAGEIIRVANRQ
jgi:hypothetical protein